MTTGLDSTAMECWAIGLGLQWRLDEGGRENVLLITADGKLRGERASKGHLY